MVELKKTSAGVAVRLLKYRISFFDFLRPEKILVGKLSRSLFLSFKDLLLFHTLFDFFLSQRARQVNRSRLEKIFHTPLKRHSLAAQ